MHTDDDDDDALPTDTPLVWTSQTYYTHHHLMSTAQTNTHARTPFLHTEHTHAAYMVYSLMRTPAAWMLSSVQTACGLCKHTNAQFLAHNPAGASAPAREFLVHASCQRNNMWREHSTPHAHMYMVPKVHAALVYDRIYVADICNA